MSRLAEFRKLEQRLAAQLAEPETLKNDDGLKKKRSSLKQSCVICWLSTGAA
jgi:hypothetical protein